MDGTRHRRPDTSESEHPVKQRKVRKGTRSCWECKRRKVRCSFSAVSDTSTVCVACRRRRTPCVSQEFWEDYAPVSSSENRLDDESIASIHTINQDSNLESNTLLTPESSRSSTYGDYQVHSGGHKLAELSRALHAAFPAQQDIETVCRVTSGCFLIVSQMHTRPREELDHDEDKLKRDVSKIPPANTHPIILAKHMLLFANLLQEMHAGGQPIRMCEPPQQIMDRLLDTVTTLVLTKDTLVATIDGIQCVLLEGCYHANGGNLRSAWLAYRRASTLGQLLGLDRPQIPELPIIELRKKIDLHQLWFRIVYFDTMYSMMLGLPQSNVDLLKASHNTFAKNTSIDQLERLQVQVASQIIERDMRHAFADEYGTTLEIDRQLLQVARDMPNRFWLPTPQNLSSGGNEVLKNSFQETAPLMDILIYYNLLNQLHLPYILCPDSGDMKYEYSKIACIQASREVLTRFIVLVNSTNMSFFCQRVDYFVLMASMTLLLVYLGNHPQDRSKTSSAIPHLLTPHQRLSDRAMMRQILRLIERASAKGFEESQRKGVNLLRWLLSIEADAASGQNYVISAGLSKHQQETEYFDTCSSDTGNWVCINIPYLGMIKITRQVPSVPDLTNAVQSDKTQGDGMYQSSQDQVPEQLQDHSMALQHLSDGQNAENDHFPLSFQDIDLDFFDSLIRGRDIDFDIEGLDGRV